MKSISLIGFMATGKSTVAKELARTLGYPLVDLDERIAAHAQCSIAEIFAQKGEDGFRQMEHAVLAQCVQEAEIILSCGGGAILMEENRKLLRQNTFVVSLLARPAVIAQRALTDEGPLRPLLANRPPEQSLEERIAQLLSQRLVFYQEADLVIDTSDLTVAEIITNIKQALTAIKQQEEA